MHTHPQKDSTRSQVVAKQVSLLKLAVVRLFIFGSPNNLHLLICLYYKQIPHQKFFLAGAGLKEEQDGG